MTGRKISELDTGTYNTGAYLAGRIGTGNYQFNLKSVLDSWNLLQGHSVIPCSTVAWALAQSATGAGISVSNTADFLHRQVIVVSNTASGGYVRQFMNMSGSGNWLPGKSNAIDADLPWRTSLIGTITTTNNKFSWTILIGGLSSGSPPTSTANRSAAGWQITIESTGTETGTIKAVVHNGGVAIEGASQTVDFLDGRLFSLDVLWIPGDGLYVYYNNAVLCSVTTADGAMLSGILISSTNGWATLAQYNPGATGNGSVFIRPITVYIQQ